MTLEPLFNAPLAIQIHVLAVVPAAILGAYLLARPKGTPRHRLLGKVWMALMVITALSSFFIHRINLFHGFSPIHLLSIAVLAGSWRAILAARRHDIRTHRRVVSGMYFGGIVVAGLATLLPGRLMNAVAFSGDSWMAVAVLVLVAVAVVGAIRFAPRRSRAA
ncbi:DUF2306 domain-containing protein [Sinorhizobium sp. B11]|uniref:DUF2306 domain-containing protein n=1 Tax=Rhizobium sp. BK379 TaxID=2587059 RepID=UPI001622832D|nr:DUF2306 domain-containing protein [Rhizobium sp. BK379]MBB3441899.1 putative membrane protein [Rhizobium sp. BK379]